MRSATAGFSFRSPSGRASWSAGQSSYGSPSAPAADSASEGSEGAAAEQKDLSEEEVQRMEKEVDQKSKSSYMDWMTSKMKIGKNRSSKSEQPQQ